MDNLMKEEREIFKGAANMQYQKGPASVLGYNKGGHLTLTNQRLIFIAHAMNIGQKEYYIPLSEIKYAQNGFHILTPTPNMIKIECNNGEMYKFVVKGKEKETWKKLIMQYALEVKQKQTVELNDNASVKFCSNCGNEILTNTKFCGNCGTQIQQ